MGITNSQKKKATKLSEIWSVASRSQNHRDIYKNGSNGLLAEKYRVTIDPKYDLNSQLDIYKFRKNNTFSLVRTYDADPVDKQEIPEDANSNNICSQIHQIDVMTEMIPYRLSELPQLTFNQSIYVLRECLKAYQAVYHHIGPININSKLIGINQKGQIKAWINQNWAQNHPSSQLGKLQSTLPFLQLNNRKNLDYMLIDPIYRDQCQMVRNILDVVQSKNQRGRFPKQFSDYFYIHSNSFAEARAFVDDYVTKMDLRIPYKIFINGYAIHSKSNHGPVQTQGKTLQNSHYLPNYQTNKKINTHMLVQSRNNATTAHYAHEPPRQYKNVQQTYYKNYKVNPNQQYVSNSNFNYYPPNQRINYNLTPASRSYSAPSNKKIGVHFNQTGKDFNVNTIGTTAYSQLKTSLENEYKSNNINSNIPKISYGLINNQIKTVESQLNRQKMGVVGYEYSPIQSYSPSKVQLVNNEGLSKNRSLSVSNIKLSQTGKY